VIGYQLTGNANGDNWKNILVILNGNTAGKKITIPGGNWTLVANADTINERGIKKLAAGNVIVPATTAWVLYQD
jgi:pullulanase